MTFLANPTLRLFIGAALISLSPIWVRLADVPATTSGFYRVFIGSIALSAYLLVTRRSLHLTKRAWWFLIGAAIFLTVDLWFWHRSILYVGPGLSTLLGNFQVFFMMLAGVIFYRQLPTAAQLLAVPLAFLGLLLIVGLDWDSLPENYRIGVIYGLMTALIYASYMLMLRASRGESTFRVPTREVAVVSVLTTLMVTVVVFVEGASLAVPSALDLGWLIGYGVLSHSLGWLFIASSLHEVSTTEAGLALLLQPTLSFIWDVLIFDRPTTLIELAGVGIAISAIWLGSRSKQA